VSSLSDLGNTPVSSTISADVPVPGLLSNVATLKRDSVPTNSNQANIQPVYEVFASVQGRDLGGVSKEISQIVAEQQKQLAPGNYIQVIGQIQSMNDAFWDLGVGLLFAAVLVYLLMVVNYQNFGDPFVVILALPATLCGILTMLFITGTTLNVPSLMGAIMAVGVASANSILLVTFAREQQLAGKTAFEAAIDAGHTRIRPVLMTAAAMIVGMIPMAIGGSGRGAERRAGARRHRRALVCNADDAARGAVPVRDAARPQRRQGGARRFRRGDRMNYMEPLKEPAEGSGGSSGCARDRPCPGANATQGTGLRPTRGQATGMGRAVVRGRCASDPFRGPRFWRLGALCAVSRGRGRPPSCSAMSCRAFAWGRCVRATATW